MSGPDIAFTIIACTLIVSIAAVRVVKHWSSGP
jgi:hypothetical protein